MLTVLECVVLSSSLSTINDLIDKALGSSLILINCCWGCRIDKRHLFFTNCSFVS